MDHRYAVILAGGGGTRLWPISRAGHPKHVLPLIGERTLFQITLDRLDGFISPDRILIVTTAGQGQDLKNQAPQIQMENFIIEPMPKGTASVVGLAATVLAKRDPQAVMMVFPADHFIRNHQLFQRILEVAVKAAENDCLVTIGIPPTHPATGYGYIKHGNSLAGNYDLPVFQVECFIEKPDEEKAHALISEGGYSWNSGMFIWRVGRILEEFSHQMPDLGLALGKIGKSWGTVDQQGTLSTAWAALKAETIDYGIMEHAAGVVVIPAEGLDWSDVGTWDSLFEVIQPDDNGNVVVNSDHLSFDTNNSLIYSLDNKLVVTIGVDDLMIIDSGDALLVCKRDQAQKVRQVISKLKEQQKTKYL